MNKEDSNILSKIGKDSGFKVPENYFDNFAAKMEKSLLEKEFVPVIKPSLWHRARPYVYLAAMFAGIWCMMKMFNGIKGATENGIYNPEIVAGFKNDANVDDFMLNGNVSEYDIMTYEDSVAAQDSGKVEVPQEVH